MRLRAGIRRDGDDDRERDRENDTLYTVWFVEKEGDIGGQSDLRLL